MLIVLNISEILHSKELYLEQFWPYYENWDSVSWKFVDLDSLWWLIFTGDQWVYMS